MMRLKRPIDELGTIPIGEDVVLWSANDNWRKATLKMGRHIRGEAIGYQPIDALIKRNNFPYFSRYDDFMAALGCDEAEPQSISVPVPDNLSITLDEGGFVVKYRGPLDIATAPPEITNGQKSIVAYPPLPTPDECEHECGEYGT